MREATEKPPPPLQQAGQQRPGPRRGSERQQAVAGEQRRSPFGVLQWTQGQLRVPFQAAAAADVLPPRHDRRAQLAPPFWRGGATRIAHVVAIAAHRARARPATAPAREGSSPCRPGPSVHGAPLVPPLSTTRRGSEFRQQGQGPGVSAAKRCVQARGAAEQEIKTESELMTLTRLPGAQAVHLAMRAGGGGSAPRQPNCKFGPSYKVPMQPIDTLCTLHHPAACRGHRRSGRRELRQARPDARQWRQVRPPCTTAGAARLRRRRGCQQRQLRAIGGHLLL